MKYAFIDYENIHSLDGLELQKYTRVFLFTGGTLNHIRLTEKFNDEINITLITVKEVAKNNVDFHIAYYLGKLDVTVDKNIEFHILSRDQGYDGICRFIQHQRENRICQRENIIDTLSIKPEVLALPSPIDVEKEKINRAFEEYKFFMKETNKRSLPAKLITLQNNVHNKTMFRNYNKQDEMNNITKVINKLKHEKLLSVVGSKVSYP